MVSSDICCAVCHFSFLEETFAVNCSSAQVVLAFDCSNERHHSHLVVRHSILCHWRGNRMQNCSLSVLLVGVNETVPDERWLIERDPKKNHFRQFIQRLRTGFFSCTLSNHRHHSATLETHRRKSDLSRHSNCHPSVQPK